jgi:hypothetical protein
MRRSSAAAAAFVDAENTLLFDEGRLEVGNLFGA